FVHLQPPELTHFPYTTLFRSSARGSDHQHVIGSAHRRVSESNAYHGIRANFLTAVPQFIQCRFTGPDCFFFVTCGTATGNGTERGTNVCEQVHAGYRVTRNEADIGVKFATFNVVRGSKNHEPNTTH